MASPPDDSVAVLSPCACFNVRSAARAVTALYDRTLEPTGLKVHQFAILAVIRAGGSVSMQRLAAELGLDPSTMTRTMRPLEARALVCAGAANDRRIKELALTDDGERVFRHAYTLWQAAQDRVRELVGDDVFARLVGDLATVTSKISKSSEATTSGIEPRGERP